MKIEIWSDFACPYCYIGKKKLEMALEEIDFKNDLEVKFRSFQLNENAVSQEGKDLNRLIAEKYGISYEQAKAANQNIINMAKEVGLNFDFENIKPGNTGLAHEVFKYCESVGKGIEMANLLFQSYFEKGEDISNKSQLISLAETIDIDVADLNHAINEGSYKDDVKNDQKKAHKLGIDSVPFFIFNNQFSVSGAQSIETFKSALEQVKLKRKDFFL